MDWKGFKKLFDVHIPVNEHAEYYIDVLSRSPQFSHLPELVKEFEEFEERIAPKSVKQEKLETMERVIQNLRCTHAYQAMNDYPLCDRGGLEDKRSAHSDGQWLLSLDLVCANWHVYRSFGVRLKTWDELCSLLMVAPIFAQSKSFRQYIFGNLNPRRNHQIQAEKTRDIQRCLVEKAFTQSPPVVFLEHDEIMWACPEGMTIQELIGLVKRAVERFNETTTGNFPVRLRPQRREPLPGRKRFLITYYDPETLEESYKTLFGVPGNQYIEAFKRHILHEPIEDRDLYFVEDGRLARWVEEES